MRKRDKPRHPLHVVRVIVQLAFLALFLVLLVLTALGTGVTARPWLAQVFLITDPLVLVGMALAGAFTTVLLAAMGVVALSLFLPRAYCGWICPLGTTMDIVDRLLFRKRDRARHAWPHLRQAKYGLLAVLLVLAVFRLGVFGWFDPICIATRSFGTAVYPMADRAAKAALVAAEEAGAAPAGRLYDWAEANRLLILDSNFKEGGYGAGYAWAWVFTALLLAIVLAQAYQKRFWCRNFCPLGALMGLLGSASPFRPRVRHRCIACDACRQACKTGAFQPGHAPSAKEGKHRYTCLVQECIFCYACEREFCPADAIHIGSGRPAPVRPEAQVCPGRRAFLGAAATGVVLGPALLLDQRTRQKAETNPQFRPPGSLRPDEEFMAACIRCGQCMKACPTNALHPSGVENGIAGLWTPSFIFNVGYCDYLCAVTRADVDAGRTGRPANLCGIVCPTGAIAKLTHAEKVQWKIGTAVFDHNRCLPWARGEECLTCEEQCPLPDKAISHQAATVANLEWLKMPQDKRNRCEELQGRLARGETLSDAEQKELAAFPPRTRTLAQPYVLRDRCIGCGTCENVCPVDGPGGIRVERLQMREIRAGDGEGAGRQERQRFRGGRAD
ncbi:MAG: 4Fe-4S binding protein [Planctomycetes bacterium]|nr:4Fe-4S binding protein [Planctomycetota bacterium]